MELAAAVFVAMAAMPCPMDEPLEQCAPWRTQVAIAIADTASEATCTADTSDRECVPVYKGAPEELAAWLLEIGYHESGFRKRIQAGDCRIDECDYSAGRHLAHSLWQLHRTPTIPGVVGLVPTKVWKAAVGANQKALHVAAAAAVRTFVYNPQGFGVRPGSPGPRGRDARRIQARIVAALDGPQD